MEENEITKDWLIEQYLTLNKNALQICQEFKIKHTNIIMQKLEEFQIEKKKKGRTKGSTIDKQEVSEKTIEEPISFFIGEEEFKIRDRVRLGETINGVKESNLCEIIDIRKSQSGEIKVDLLTVMNHQKLTVLTSKLTLV